MPQKR